MGKILAQTGISLPDVYDIEGSVAGVEFLATDDVSLTHEMGGQIFSERLSNIMVHLGSGELLQNVDFNMNDDTLPDCPHRILGVACLVSAGGSGRLGELAVSLRDAGGLGEMPFFVWDSTLGDETRIRYSLQGAAIADMFYLSGGTMLTPTLALRTNDLRAMSELNVRGSTLAFGGGTVTITVVVSLARATRSSPTPGEPSSHGLPLPSW
jgi:hypothetical protein